MHGRLKVRTSEEQEEAKRKEKERKVKWYRQLTEKIFDKRANEEKDDEQLKLTMDILLENSDISTLWVIRREVLDSRLASLTEEEVTKLCLKELTLLERCLRVNPKAYCIWLHRQWIMEHAPSPDWDRERQLCDLFLSHDERNFHCWDYRRYAVQKAGISNEDEFGFSTEKIATNFSNYSAWHYRSKLLPAILSSTQQGNQHSLENEYDMAHNAFYTDPVDQSPWFYHKWLLGRGDKPLVIGCGLLQRCPTHSVTVSFNQPIKPTKECPVIFSVNNVAVTKLVKTDWPKRVWSCDLSIANEEGVAVMVEYKQLKIELTAKPNELKEVWFIGELSEMFKETVTNASRDILHSELAVCRELLDLEPENKWCVLTTLQLLQAIDPLKHHQEILTLFNKLVAVDPYRKGYYRDLRSRHVIGYELWNYLTHFNPTTPLDLSNKGLTRLYYTEYMTACHHIDLHGNQLSRPSLEEGLVNLRSIKFLNLSNNQLQGDVPVITLSSLQSLESLYLDDNGIPCDLKPLNRLKNLQTLSLKGNSLSQDFMGVVKAQLTQINSLEF